MTFVEATSHSVEAGAGLVHPPSGWAEANLRRNLRASTATADWQVFTRAETHEVAAGIRPPT